MLKEVAVIMPCGHPFHKKCITPWLKLHNTCPICRFAVETNDKEYNTTNNIKNNTQLCADANRMSVCGSRVGAGGGGAQESGYSRCCGCCG